MSDDIDAICEQIAAMIMHAILANARGDVRIAKQIVRQCIKLAHKLPVTLSRPSVH